MNEKSAIPAAARHFDELPDSALVDVRTVAIVEGLAVATIWRRVARGMFPKPEPRQAGTNATRWSVGALRRARGERRAAA